VWRVAVIATRHFFVLAIVFYRFLFIKRLHHFYPSINQRIRLKIDELFDIS